MALAEPIDHRRAFHPAVSILCWLFFALAVERAGSALLAVISLVLGLTAAVWPVVAPDMIRMFRRSRWLLLSMLLLYAWTTNGAWIWPQIGGYSPTWSGLEMGLERIVRLVLVLAALAVLMRMLPRQDLVGGLFQLTWPFAKLGFDRRAFAVRLALAMEWAKEERTKPARNMLDALNGALNEEQSGPDEIHFVTHPPGWMDGLALASMVMLLGMTL